MTAQERHLWYDCLKSLPVTVRRQHIIGDYIVDFYIAAIKTVVEIDGSQHYEDSGIKADIKRDEYLRQNGYSVVRYSNREIDCNFQAVCDDIYNRISAQSGNNMASPSGGSCHEVTDEGK